MASFRQISSDRISASPAPYAPPDPSSLRREGDEFVIDLVVRPNGFVVLGIGHKIIEEEFHDLSCFLESNMGFNDSEPDEQNLEQIRKTIVDYRHEK